MNVQQGRLPVRRRLRLAGFDYGRPGAYFITVCTLGGPALFGVIRDDRVIESAAGAVVRAAWNDLSRRFPDVELDAFVVMPDHVHCVIVLAENGPALGEVVGAFKSLAARAVNRTLKRRGALWQRGYYEHIVRNEDDLNHIRRYIATNPAYS